ncbi:MAG TPA: histidine phosphatase family protein [Ignavibacteriaceae bacterium]|nr:histidine phosphatase family protein [Ignavibacteriaceae bacterium]
MNIYLIRHSDAEKSSENIKDNDRKLTPEGEQKAKICALGWKNIIKGFDFIVSSPLARAIQTAKIISEVFEHKKDIVIDKRITCGTKTEDLIELANSLGGEEMAFVGHEPDFSEHVSRLVSISGAFVEFKKCAIAKISFQNKARIGKGILEFLIPPKAYK